MQSETWPILGQANGSFNGMAVEQAISQLGLGSRVHTMNSTGKGNRGTPAAPIPALIRQLIAEIDSHRNAFNTGHANFHTMPESVQQLDLPLINSFRDADGYVKHVLRHESEATAKVLRSGITINDLCSENITEWTDSIIVPLIEARWEALDPAHPAFQSLAAANNRYVEGSFRSKNVGESSEDFKQAKAKAILARFRAQAKGEIKKALARLLESGKNTSE